MESGMNQEELNARQFRGPIEMIWILIAEYRWVSIMYTSDETDVEEETDNASVAIRPTALGRVPYLGRQFPKPVGADEFMVGR